MTKARFAALFLLPAILAACSTTRSPAPVLDRTDRSSEVRPAVVVPPSPRASDPRGYYTVQRGDTLIQIALEFGQNYRDLVTWNDLANPNDIKVGQLLRVLPPEGGPQTGVIAGGALEVRPLNPQSAPAQAGVPNKTAPRGDKRPYSDAALAELQKQEQASSSAETANAAPRPSTPTPPQATTSIPGDENISWIWPAEGKVIAPFGDGRRGIAIGGKLGQPVLAAGGGKVLYAGSGIRGYGNLVIVKHTNNLLSAYAHNKTIFVKEDQTVAQGQKIAEMGNSDADEVKLHFEIRHQGKPVDPTKFLPTR